MTEQRQDFSGDELKQVTIRLPEKLTRKLRKTETALVKAPNHCNDFFCFSG